MKKKRRIIVGGLFILGFVSWIGTIFLYSACENREPNIAPKKASFDELFEREEQVILTGDSLTPVFSFFTPLITADKIYVCDYMGHYVAIYDKTGKLIKKFGKKGKGPEEFQMPYGTDWDVQGNLYINDRQNQRVQIYDPSLKFLKAMPMPGQNEIMLVRKTGPKPNIVMVGTTSCRAGYCLLQDSLLANSKISAPQNYFFGKVVPKFSLSYLDGRQEFNFQKYQNSTYFLFVFFSPWDCPSCFVETPFWNQLKSTFKNRLTVLAIGSAGSRETLRHFVQRNEISIPTLFDQGQLLFMDLGLVDSGLTPIKILTTSRGMILHAAQSTYNDSTKQVQYIKLLDALVP